MNSIQSAPRKFRAFCFDSLPVLETGQPFKRTFMATARQDTIARLESRPKTIGVASKKTVKKAADSATTRMARVQSLRAMIRKASAALDAIQGSVQGSVKAGVRNSVTGAQGKATGHVRSDTLASEQNGAHLNAEEEFAPDEMGREGVEFFNVTKENYARANEVSQMGGREITGGTYEMTDALAAYLSGKDLEQAAEATKGDQYAAYVNGTEKEAAREATKNDPYAAYMAGVDVPTTIEERKAAEKQAALDSHAEYVRKIKVWRYRNGF